MIRKARDHKREHFVAFQPKRMRALRLKRGLTLRRMADQMDLDWVTLQRYELGKIEPKINRAAEIAKLLKASVSYLCGEVDDPDLVLRLNDLPPEEREAILAGRSGDLEAQARRVHKAVTKNKGK